MIHRIPARLRSVVERLLQIGMVLGCLAASLVAQDTPEPGSDSKPLPYRRVFVRESELPSLALDSYRPVELGTLERLLAQLAHNQERIDRNLAIGEPEILSFHAQAKLSGADLIAERSRIQWRDDGSHQAASFLGAQRKTLSPWSPAIDNTMNKSAGATSLISPMAPTWLFDASGAPSVRPSGTEDWFSWSLRPQRDSTPNRLNFSFSFPRTHNSCLVVQLPKGARIVDSTVVVRGADAWNEVVGRLGTWPVVSGSPEAIPELNATDAYWILELSGQEQASFSILLGSNRTAVNSIASSDPSSMPFTRLIAKQATQYQISKDQLRTVCEWEWFEGPSPDKTVRLRVPEGFRLRSLTINDRETNLQFAQRVVEATLPPIESPRSAVPAMVNRTRMNAEFLVDLDALRSNAPRLTIPPVEFLGSYVVSGTSALVPQGALQLHDISFSSGRLDATRALPGDSARLDYTWFQAPPTFTLQASPKERAHRAELLTKLSTDGQKAIAIVRIQLAAWQSGMPDRVVVPPRWKLESAQLNSKAFTLKEDDSADVGLQSLRLEPIGPADDAPLQIELQLSRNMPTASDGILDSEPLVQLPGWDRTDALVMEPSYAMRLEAVGNYVDEIAEEESLTPWQRERLPRLGKYLILRMQEGRLPALRWKSEAQPVSAHIATDVRVHLQQWRVQHRIELSSSSAQEKPVNILLAGTWRWEISSSDGEGARRVAMVQDPSTQGWRIATQELDAMRSESQTKSQPATVLIATQSFESSAASEVVSLPRIPNADTLTQTVRIDPRLRVNSQDPIAQWEFDTHGNQQLRWTSLPRDSGPIQIEVARNPRFANREWSVSRSQLHLATDALGSQKGLLLAEVMSLDGMGFELPVVLPADWSPHRAALKIHNAEPSQRIEAPTLRRDGERWIVQWRPATHDGKVVHTPKRTTSASNMTLELSLQGPPLKIHHYWDYGVFPSKGMEFQWPEVAIPDAMLAPSQFLWLPNPMQLGGPRPDTLWNHRWDAPRNERLHRSDMPALGGWWSMWSWSHEIQQFLGLSSGMASDSTEQRFAPPEALVPSWMAPQWLLADARTDPSQPILGSEILILRNPPNTSIPALVVALWMLLGPWVLHRRPWFCLMVAGVSVLAGHWMPNEIAMVFRASLVGMGIGTILYLAYGVYTSLDARTKDRTPRNERWSPWNEPSLTTDPISENSGRTKAALTASLLLVLTLGMGTLGLDAPCMLQPAQGQEAASRLAGLPDTIFDILIPLNDESSWSGDTVYVPADVLKSLDNAFPESISVERNASLISAKHSLRFDSRSIGFGNTEQTCVHTYEIWVGDMAVGRPWRIPFQSDRSRLNRFTIDGTEVAVSRFTKNDTELIWYPERSGRKVLQIESQLRIRPLDRERNATNAPVGLLADTKPPRGWAIDAAILPAANATLEVETDGPWSLEIASRGRISNPSIGKYSFQLGGLDRLSGELVAATNPGQRPFSSTPAESASIGSVDAPQMNTELFIDREQLLARTIIEYARGAEMMGEIEIESDMQWQPVGSGWGDAQLVDVRPGSTLDRRRYIVRWNPETPTTDASANATGGATGAPNPSVASKRSIITTWIPVGESNVRNILFAECRDRRVRPGTLRYARASGSVWTLDGISAWIPSINTRERIEWTELMERPIATSLKIPLSGGFGVLRKQVDTSVPRARVTHQWLLENSRVNLRSKIELSAPVNNRSSLVLKLPASYKATKALSRSNSIPFVQWNEGSGNSIQLFIDRDNNDLNELVLHSEIPIADMNPIAISLPTMEIAPLPIAQQIADLSADALWRVEIPGESLRPVRGQGPSKVLASIPLSIDSPQTNVLAQRYVEPWNGILVARELATSDTGTDWELRLAGDTPRNPRPTFALSLPLEIARQWKSDESIRELPELEPGRKLLIVEPRWNDELQQHALRIELSTESGISIDTHWAAKIHPIAQPDLQVWFAMEPPNLEAIDLEHEEIMTGELAERIRVTLPDNSQWVRRKTMGSESHERNLGDEPVQPEASKKTVARRTTKSSESSADDLSLPLAIHELLGRKERGVRTAEASWSLHSTYWINSRQDEPSSKELLRWSLGPNTRCEWATVNGKSVDFDQQVQLLEIDFVPVGYPMQIELWTTFEGPSEMQWNAGLIQQHSPSWRGGSDIPTLVAFRESLLNSERIKIECARTRANLTSLGAIQSLASDSNWLKNPSDPRSRWLEFFTIQSADGLRSLASESLHPSDDCFGDLLEQFQSLTSDMPESQRRTIQHRWRTASSWIDASLLTATGRFQTQSTQDASANRNNATFADWMLRHRDRLIATLCLGLALVMTAWFWQATKAWFLRSPWRQLGIMGGLIWLLTGDFIAAAILMAIGLYLAIDTYRILNERFRQSGTRALR